ncbi:hypothetical protein ACIBJI_23955 [Nocardia sp. NPDC050408]|uniref:hypothetical protein n=1 Tax=Nocardia sp. NPDC050408 TaxID=3364319 RepID=UPI0037AE958B
MRLPVDSVDAAAGLAVSAVTHNWADRRTPLAWLADRLGISAIGAACHRHPPQNALRSRHTADRGPDVPTLVIDDLGAIVSAASLTVARVPDW